MRYICLDIIRCIAISLLLLAHIGQTIGSPIGRFFGIHSYYYVSLGGIAVTIFLILSGCLLQMQYGSKVINYREFLVRRILRIYPVYYLSMIIGIIIYIIHSYHDGPKVSFLGVFDKLSIGDIVLSTTGAYAFAGRWGGPFVGTSWFIAVIMSMYIIFPFLSRKIIQHPHISIGLLFLISSLSRVILGNYEILPMRSLDWFPLCRIFEFSLGMYLAVIWRKIELNQSVLLECLAPFVSFISKMSFPLFLVHYPLLFTIDYLTRRGTNQLLAIIIFVILSALLSWIIMIIDKKIPKFTLLKKWRN